MDPAAPPWQGLVTCPEWSAGIAGSESPSHSPAVQYAVRQRQALESIAGGPGAIADLSPFALKSVQDAATKPRRSERTVGNTEDCTSVIRINSVATSEVVAESWPKELSDADKIIANGFVPAADAPRRGLASLVPTAKIARPSNNCSLEEFNPAQSFTEAYTAWGLEPEPVDSQTEAAYDSETAHVPETAHVFEAAPLFETVKINHPDLASMDMMTALRSFNGSGVEIEQTIDWTGKRVLMQTAPFGVLTESWTPCGNGKMLYDMVLQDELKRELFSENINQMGIRTIVHTTYADADGKKSHVVAQRVTTSSDSRQPLVTYG